MGVEVCVDLFSRAGERRVQVEGRRSVMIFARSTCTSSTYIRH